MSPAIQIVLAGVGVVLAVAFPMAVVSLTLGSGEKKIMPESDAEILERKRER